MLVMLRKPLKTKSSGNSSFNTLKQWYCITDSEIENFLHGNQIRRDGLGIPEENHQRISKGSSEKFEFFRGFFLKSFKKLEDKDEQYEKFQDGQGSEKIRRKKV